MKRIVLLTALAAYAWSASAQEMTPQEEALKKREINEIKWSENAVTAEVIEYMADDSEKTITAAQQKSMMLLQTHVIEIFAKRLKMDKKDVQEIWDVIDDKCQNIEIRRGDLVRVFTYVMKDALGLTPSKPKKKDLDKFFGDADTTANETAVADTLSTQPVNTAPRLVENPVQEDTVSVAKAEPSVPATTLTATTPVATPAVPVAVEPAPQPTPEPTPEPAPQPTPEIEVPALCKTLLAQKSMTDLLKYLDTEKAYEKLIYGSERSMRRTSECYIVIVDKASKQVVTVLDKGAADRMNFVTKQMDNFNNYRTGGKYQAVFVQEQ